MDDPIKKVVVKLDDIHEEVKGVRTRLERHAEESTYEREKMHAENKRGWLRIHQMFREFLEAVRNGRWPP